MGSPASSPLRIMKSFEKPFPEALIGIPCSLLSNISFTWASFETQSGLTEGLRDWRRVEKEDLGIEFPVFHHPTIPINPISPSKNRGQGTSDHHRHLNLRHRRRHALRHMDGDPLPRACLRIPERHRRPFGRHQSDDRIMHPPHRLDDLPAHDRPILQGT